MLVLTIVSLFVSVMVLNIETMTVSQHSILGYFLPPWALSLLGDHGTVHWTREETTKAKIDFHPDQFPDWMQHSHENLHISTRKAVGHKEGEPPTRGGVVAGVADVIWNWWWHQGITQADFLVPCHHQRYMRKQSSGPGPSLFTWELWAFTKRFLLFVQIKAFFCLELETWTSLCYQQTTCSLITCSDLHQSLHVFCISSLLSLWITFCLFSVFYIYWLWTPEMRRD